MEKSDINRIECVCASIGRERYKMLIQSHGHSIIADESIANGGKNLGMDPESFLLASLASCTVYILRTYADNHNWSLDGAEVRVIMSKNNNAKFVNMKKEISLYGDLSQTQRERLLEAASKCSADKILTGNIIISSELSN